MKEGWLQECADQGMLLAEEEFEWFGSGTAGQVSLAAPRLWRKHREVCRTPLFKGIRVGLCGAFDQNVLQMLQNVISGGGGKIYSRATVKDVKDGLDLLVVARDDAKVASVSPVQEAIAKGVPCVSHRFIPDLIAQPSSPQLRKHAIGSTRYDAWCWTMRSRITASATKRVSVCHAVLS